MPALITVDASAVVSSSVTWATVSFAAVVCAEVWSAWLSLVSEALVFVVGVIPQRLQVAAVPSKVNNTRMENSGNNLFFIFPSFFEK
jgi:hypothetical protein